MSGWTEITSREIAQSILQDTAIECNSNSINTSGRVTVPLLIRILFFTERDRDVFNF